MATKPPKSSYDLSLMTRLSQAVYELAAPSGAITQNGDPELIILATWTQARDNHIAKYVRQYRKLYPSSRILVTKCDFSFVLLPKWIGRMLLRPAAYAIQSVAARPSDNDKGPRILWHIFSNGGLMTAMTIRMMLMGGTASLDAVQRIPRHVAIFESCPGSSSHQAVHGAMMAALPPACSIPAHMLLYFLEGLDYIRGRHSWVKENALLANLPHFRQIEMRRLYIHGTGDQIADWRRVERHIDLAKRVGFRVKAVKFEGGEHVASVQVDGARYWDAIKETWSNDDVEKADLKAPDNRSRLRASL